jgi:hypothetical protein
LLSFKSSHQYPQSGSRQRRRVRISPTLSDITDKAPNATRHSPPAFGHRFRPFLAPTASDSLPVPQCRRDHHQDPAFVAPVTSPIRCSRELVLVSPARRPKPDERNESCRRSGSAVLQTAFVSESFAFVGAQFGSRPDSRRHRMLRDKLVKSKDRRVDRATRVPTVAPIRARQPVAVGLAAAGLSDIRARRWQPPTCGMKRRPGTSAERAELAVVGRSDLSSLDATDRPSRSPRSVAAGEAVDRNNRTPLSLFSFGDQ